MGGVRRLRHSNAPGAAESQTVVKRGAGLEKYNWRIADISKLFNRPLADEVDGDGKGGWTDQGPLADLRNLYAGDSPTTTCVSTGKAGAAAQTSITPLTS